MKSGDFAENDGGDVKRVCSSGSANAERRERLASRRLRKEISMVLELNVERRWKGSRKKPDSQPLGSGGVLGRFDLAEDRNLKPLVEAQDRQG